MGFRCPGFHLKAPPCADHLRESTIRKKTVTRSGKEYTYWEARYTEGVDPGTGKQIQRSITAKTQKEVSQKLKAATSSLDAGTYIAPCKMTAGEWLDIWTRDYLGGVKPRTVESYKSTVAVHLKPELGAIKLDALNAHTIQSTYNGLAGELSPKTIKNIHGVFHKALQQAVRLGYVRFNPADACELPRVERSEVKPLDSTEISAFLNAIHGHRFEAVYMVTLFTGMRRGEVLGLTWDCVDFDKGTIFINKQLQKDMERQGEYRLISTKNSKGRTVTPAASIVGLLKKHRAQQSEMRLKAGPLWEDGNYVFTDGLGHHLSPHTVYHNYKKLVASIGLPAARFHDLRHSYAVAALQSGDDVKTVQQNLGHHAAAFTLDVYAHVTDQMRKDSADRMEAYIKGVSNL